MEPSDVATALAKTSAALVQQHDIAGFLAALLDNCIDVLDVDACGILIEDDGRLELLAASSHAAAELELHQAHTHEGPCVDAQATGEAVHAIGVDLMARWPHFAPKMIASGFASVHASPLRWQGTTLGAMGFFRRAEAAMTPEEETVAQAFADLATLPIVQTDKIDLDVLRVRVEKALTARITIEQAKGVIAEVEAIDMATAYQSLLHKAEADGHNLTAIAREVVNEGGDQS